MKIIAKRQLFQPLFFGKLHPLFILLSYLIFGFTMFLLAPFNWVISNVSWLAFYFLMILVAVAAGFSIPLRNRVMVSNNFSHKYLIVAGAILAVILLVPSFYLYSGKYPWQFFDLLSDQSEAYTNYQMRLRDSTQADRAPVAILRTLFHPIVFAALPLSIIHWRDLSWLYRSCGIVVIVCLLLISVARGTDLETFDILVFVSASGLVAYFRTRNWSVENVRLKSKKQKVKRYLVLFFAIAVVFFVIFVDRKLGRYGGHFDRLCIGDGTICILNTAFGSNFFGEWGAFAVGITASYIGQGYYGLGLAMSLDFHSTLGTGWSRLIARFYEAFADDPTMYNWTFTYRMRSMGWNDDYSWSTLMVWFANDVGFAGALVILFGFMLMFGAAWRDAVLGRDDKAAIVFVMLFLMVVYLPANNQIGQTLDLTFAFWVWVAAWRLNRTRKFSFPLYVGVDTSKNYPLLPAGRLISRN